MLFAAFPIVYEQERGWSAGVGGLAFIGKLALPSEHRFFWHLIILQVLPSDLCLVFWFMCEYHMLFLDEVRLKPYIAFMITRDTPGLSTSMMALLRRRLVCMWP
jgi:hypothetical protein